MNAQTYVAEVRAAIDARLEVLLGEAESNARRAGDEPLAVASAVAALVRRGGKRLRPALLAASALSCGRAMDATVIDAGCAWELLQAYFLVHDDWMDGDATRRGGPTVHVTLSERHKSAHLGASLAVLAGDLACALAHRVIAATDAPREALVTFARVHEDVVLGQTLDLTLGAHDLAAVERMHALKTASYTTRGPVAIGAILAGCEADMLDAFATPLGVAFQLRDDLLGAFGSSAETGKPVGSDLQSGKRTALIAEAFMRTNDRGALERSLDAGDVPAVMSILESSGARSAVEARAAALLTASLRALDSAPIADKSLLAALANALVERRV
jgi:geranylgeranyl diphosphate synthase, type I